MKNKVRVGLFGIGLDTYWGQFEGLLYWLLKVNLLTEQPFRSEMDQSLAPKM